MQAEFRLNTGGTSQKYTPGEGYRERGGAGRESSEYSCAHNATHAFFRGVGRGRVVGGSG